MQLRVKGKDGTIVNVDKLLAIEVDADNLIVSDAGDDSNTIVFQTDRDSYEVWYNRLMDKKYTAMCVGGKVNEQISFEVGRRVYTHAVTSSDDDDEITLAGRPYIRAISSAEPDTNGNVQLLPGNTLDVVPRGGNRISFEQLSIPINNSIGGILRDINRCVWYLYHTYNSFIYRMNLWEPGTRSAPMFTDARMLGTIQAYQAVVAAWNIRVWRRSFLWDISPIREVITFNIGYMSLDCVATDISCIVTITVISSHEETTKFLTLYDQGIATNLALHNVKTSIIKTTRGAGSVVVSGDGSDEAVEKERDWSEMQAKIDIAKIEQGEYYKASFSLAVARSEVAKIHYQDVAEETHHMRITAQWVINGSTYTIMQEVHMPAMVLYEDIPEKGYIE